MVEDHPDTLKYLRLYLEQLGHEVGGAATRGAALELIRAGEWDLLLSDIALPDGTGWDLIESLGDHRPPVAVAFSAYDSPADVRRSLASGFQQTFSKPLQPEKLDQLLKQVSETISPKGSSDPL